MAEASAPTKFSFNTEFVKNSPYNADPLTVQKIKQEGFAEGVQEGERNAEKRLYEEFSAQLGALEEHYARLEEARLSYIKILTEKAVKVLQASLEHLLKDAAENYTEDLLKAGLSQVLDNVGQDAKLLVRIHPATRAYLDKLKPTLLEGRQIEFQDDVQLAPGDCVAEWNTGGIDARLEEMLEDIQHLFHGASFATPSGEPLQEEENKEAAALEPAPETAEIEAEAPTEEKTEEIQEEPEVTAKE